MSKFLKKIITIIGPESTGKSTLSAQLAHALSCPMVAEYARDYLEQRPGAYTLEDLSEIAQMQQHIQSSMSEAHPLCIFDTNLEVIKVWSEHAFGTCSEWILQRLGEQPDQFYILTDIDLPWQSDPLREHPEPEMRRYFFEIYKDIVLQSGFPFCIVRGTEDARREAALTALKPYLAS